MTLAELTAMFEAAAGATRTVQQCYRTALTTLDAEAHPLPENGQAHLVDAPTVLRKLQDVRVMVATAIDAMTKVQWPSGGAGGHYQEYIDLQKQAKSTKPTRPAA